MSDDLRECTGEPVYIDPPNNPGFECDCDSLEAAIDSKQDKLTAGDNITIENNVISATGGGATYEAGTNIDITDNVISAPDVYTKEETDALVEAIKTGEFVVVDELPSTGEEKNIYLVPKIGGGYTEYVYVDGAWEEIGDTDIDLSDYYTKSEVDEKLAEKISCDDLADCSTITAMQTAISGKQDKLTAGDNVSITGNTISATDTTYENATAATAGLMSATDKAKLDAIDTSNFITCETLSDCDTIADMNTAISGKQDALIAGDNITIANGVISAQDTTYTKEDILEMLGYTDQKLSMTNENGHTVIMHVLGYMEEEEDEAIIERNEPIDYAGDDEYGQFGTYPVNEPEETTRVKLTVTNATINGVDFGTFEVESYYSPGGALFECLPLGDDFGCMFISFWGGNAGVYAPDGQIFAFIGQDGDGPQVESFTADSLKVEVV